MNQLSNAHNIDYGEKVQCPNSHLKLTHRNSLLSNTERNTDHPEDIQQENFTFYYLKIWKTRESGAAQGQ